MLLSSVKRDVARAMRLPKRQLSVRETAAEAARKLMGEFAVSRAIRRLDTAPAMQDSGTPAVLDRLRDLFPAEPLAAGASLPHVARVCPMSMEEVRRALPQALTRCGRISSPGPTGLRAEHLREVIPFTAFGAEEELAHLIAALLGGAGPAWIRDASLVPIPKREGGVRSTLR